MKRFTNSVGNISLRSISTSTILHQRPLSAPEPASLLGLNKKTLDDDVLRSISDPDTYQAFQAARHNQTPMSKSRANDLANSIRLWAMQNGADSYSHWFSPMRGAVHGEKVETFADLNYKTGKLIIGLSGERLFQTETDGSSFPNGGLRETHEAASFIGWDTASHPFLYDNILYIPSSFVSWTGEALDQKTPLLRSQEAINKQSLRLLKLLGDTETTEVVANVGWEQEFFVIDRKFFDSRPDLIATGRTVMGESPMRGQEQSLNYFSKMPTRVRQFINEARDRMWEVGISMTCSHAEVAPGQYELCPIFTRTNYAADSNVLAMELLKDIARERGLAVLFHEKPFANINGSGKHNNWGLNTDTGHNLFVPGKTTAEGRRFVAFVSALARGVKQHGDLLRAGVSSPGNDHRLGAQEAPPPIYTLSLGAHLESHLLDFMNGAKSLNYHDSSKTLHIGGSVVDIKANLEDRNRTAPIPWCTNRFEFRAVGSGQHIAFPLTMLHAAVADGISQICDDVEAGADLDEVLRSTIKENQGALFCGDGYDAEGLAARAEKYDLFNIKTSPEAYELLSSAKNVKLFSNLNILNEREVKARKEVLLEDFSNTLEIEARTMLHMTTKVVHTAAVEMGVEKAGGILDKGKATLVADLMEKARVLKQATRDVPPGSSERAKYSAETLKPLMAELRSIADELEGEMATYPYPTYSDMLAEHY